MSNGKRQPMSKRTESLSYPSNPLAAIRELQNLDSLAESASRTRSKAEAEAPLHVAPATSSEVASVTGSATTLANSGQRSSEESSTVASARAANPMHAAIKGMLAKPYSPGHGKGSFTVTTVKIATEIWERLGWVSSLTGQAKQEIIAQALQAHFERLAMLKP